MKIHSNNIKNGYFDDAMGHRGTQFIKSMPSRSFHLAWDDLPAGTKSLALIFIDYDSIPVCGFPWIHWTVANIDPSLGALPENASVELNLLEGVNSWNSGLLSKELHLGQDDAASFGGCAPPDREHQYTIKLIALDTKLNLPHGFYMNELIHAMDGHILGKAKLKAWYKPKMPV